MNFGGFDAPRYHDFPTQGISSCCKVSHCLGGGEPTMNLTVRVEAMKLSKDKKALFYNDFFTLSGIPSEVYDYRLGNRSALEWVIDQCRVTHDETDNITSDPNRLDDEQYILWLVGKVISVSLETMKVISGMPSVQTVPSDQSEPL
jgi:predicted helicase